MIWRIYDVDCTVVSGSRYVEDLTFLRFLGYADGNWLYGLPYRVEDLRASANELAWELARVGAISKFKVVYVSEFTLDTGMAFVIEGDGKKIRGSVARMKFEKDEGPWIEYDV